MAAHGVADRLPQRLHVVSPGEDRGAQSAGGVAALGRLLDREDDRLHGSTPHCVSRPKVRLIVSSSQSSPSWTFTPPIWGGSGVRSATIAAVGLGVATMTSC